MAITEETRHHLYRRLETTLGREEATILMEHLPPVGWADVATKSDLGQLETVLSKDMEALQLRFQADMGTLEHGIRGDMSALEHRLHTDMGELRVDVGEKFNRLLFQLLAAQAVFTTLVLAISRRP